MTAGALIDAADVAGLGPAPAGGDAVVAQLDAMMAWLGGQVAAPVPAVDAVRIDRVAGIERLKSALEALQAVESVAFARSQVAEQQLLGVAPELMQRGIADQLALACGVSPSEGSRRLLMARDLVQDMPHTLGALTRGDIGPWSARLVVGELSHLQPTTRAEVDEQLAHARLAEKSPRQCELAARRLAQAADPAAAVERARSARADRRVTLRPAPDTMSLLTALIPVEQGVACLAALRGAADAGEFSGDPRGRGQIMSDTLVERLTGQSVATAITAEVQIVMPVEALRDAGDPSPVDLPGHGSLPAEIARQILARTDGDIYWRRLLTEPGPDGGPMVVGIDRRRRRFAGPLAALIDARDGHHCRDPYCDAPIRAHDHIRRYADDGATTTDNGRGVCQRGNLVRELPGWSVRVVDAASHTVETTTPTGHRYLSRPPEPP